LSKHFNEEKLKESISEYNKYRTPEATAKLVSIENNRLKIEFKGHFCFTCGFYDYFDDLRFLLEDNNIITEIIKIDEIDQGAVVTFNIKS
jgi:superoxide reductase